MQTLTPFLTPILEELDQFFNSCAISNEHEIIRHLQDNEIAPFNLLKLDNTKDLFSAHFLCMHALYSLKQQYRLANKFSLLIEAVRVQRIPLDNPTSSKTKLKTAIEAADPLASYYLNAQHYFETQEDEINDLLKSFWQKYRAQDHKKAALETLNLPMDANTEIIKAQYLRLAQKHHPDKGGSAEMFNKIRQAKTVLDKIF